MYMPKGMEPTAEEQGNGGANPVLKLQRSLYGLKQAGRLWNALLHKKLIELGFSQCKTDLCLYYKRMGQDIILVGVYVDDLLSTATQTSLVKEFFDEMKTLDVKDLGTVAKFLGIRLELQQDHGYSLDQEHMIRELVESNGMTGSKPIATPISEFGTDELDDEVVLDHVQTKAFRSLAGALLWIARCTRPDISFAVHRLTRRTHAPRAQDWRLAKRILRYLNGTSALKLHMKPTSATTDLQFEVFSDADYAADTEDRKSISASVVYLNGLLIAWMCSKQDNVTLSTMESEFVAGARSVQLLLGCIELAKEIGESPRMPSYLNMDNQAAISQVESEASSSKTKHVDIKHKFIKDYYRKGIIKTRYVPTTDMIADLQTKALGTVVFQRLRAMIGLANSSSPHSGGVLE
jgi:hypothetical protein